MHRVAHSTLVIASGLMAMTAAHAADIAVKAPALAQDLAPVAAWEGFHLGAGVGFRASDTNVNVTSATDTTAALPALQNMFFASGCSAGLPCVTGRPFNGTAFRISPYLGYDWQIGRALLGIEGDVGFADQTTTLLGSFYPATPFATATGSPTNSFSVRTSWDASLRARAGYLIDPAVLLYGTAGPSWIHVETTSNCSTLLAADGACAAAGATGFTPATITNSHTRLGYTVGGGAETMLGTNWILRAEYRFSDYGRASNTDVRTATAAVGTQTVTYDTLLRTHTATFGLAYNYGTPAGPAGGSIAAYAAMPAGGSWSGAYVGAAAGIRANQTTATLDKATVLPAGFAPFDALDNCRCFLSNGFDTTAARVSPYVGYNWQIHPKWVLGLEGDFGFADAQSTSSGNYLPGTPVFGASGGQNDSFSVRTRWDASIRARAGFLVTPSFMTFLTGGVAWMNVEETSRCDTSAQTLAIVPGLTLMENANCAPGRRSPAVITQSTTKPGFTVGAGGELKVWSNWLLRGEYRYADYGRASFTDSRSCASAAGGINCFLTETATNSLRLQSHTAMFGIAYKID